MLGCRHTLVDVECRCVVADDLTPGHRRREELITLQVSILVLSSVASYYVSAMSVFMTRCQRSNCKEQWVAEDDLVNHVEGQHLGMDRPVDVAIVRIADDRG